MEFPTAGQRSAQGSPTSWALPVSLETLGGLTVLNGF